MKGFAQRALVADVLDWVRDVTGCLAPERVPIHELPGRVLSEAAIAPIDVPSFDRSAMDGYALIASATEGASLYNPLSFAIAGQALPGSGFPGTVNGQTAVRIMTGAPIPAGADCVLPAEHATENDGRVEITLAIPLGKHIGRAAEDVASGQRVLPEGRLLRPQDVGLLASLGLPEFPVIRQPRVRLVVTGNELVAPGHERDASQIFESNSLMLSALVSRDGGLLEARAPVPPVRDDEDAIREVLARPGCDLILVSGGSSVGSEDYAPTVVAELGELLFHGVAIRPSSPTGIGLIGDTLVFLLPGNPVSCLCAYDMFAGEAVRRLGGRPSVWPYRETRGVLEERITSAIGRVDYCRVAVRGETQSRISPLALSGASILSSTTRADGFVLVPAELEGHAAGTEITVWLYDASAASSNFEAP
ncbi:MAG: molybdopterin molybdotransferase MoeA [Planctomycetaceae bacterium]|jgi:molybdopterin molybdotransferase|nr:molybdopterin molybdotransferase MoeA [Planctomycetaceae bacterium]